MTAPFRGSGPWRGRGPFLGRGPWAGKAPFGFNAGLPFQINVTAAQLRDALATPSAWGETLGPELVANGNFSNGTTGWTITGAWAEVAGQFVKTGGSTATAQQTILIVGRLYQITFNLVAISGAFSIYAGSSGAVTYTTTGSKSVLVACAGDTNLYVQCLSASTATIDNISVREVVTGWLLPGLGGARLSGDCRTSVAMQTAVDGTVGYAAHNLLTYSDAFDNAAWDRGDMTVSANQGVAPDGTTTADLLYPTTTGLSRYVWRPSSLLTAAAQAVTVSWYVKASSWTWVMLNVEGSSNGVWFNIATGAVGTASAGYSGTITSVGNGWYRTTATTTRTGTVQPTLRVCDADNSLTATASGTNGVLLWGAQLNLGSVALPYVPTGAAARFGPAIDWLSGIGAYGIRSEAARTNLVLYSADMGNAAWLTYGTGATKVGAATALGAVPMYRINVGSVGGAGNTVSAVYQSLTVAVSTVHTVSALVRAVSGTSAFRLMADHAGGNFTSADMTATTTPQLFQYTFTTGSPTTSFTISIRAATAGGVVGDIEVGGFQLEAGTEASSPILTYAAAATRAADTLVVLDSGWLSQTAGTLAADYVPRVAGTQLIAELDDATANERLSLTNDGIFTVIDGGASQAAVDGGTPTAAALNKVAASYAANAFAVSLNNGAVVTDTAGTLPTVTRMDLNALNGHITRMRYSRRRANEGTLRSLST